MTAHEETVGYLETILASCEALDRPVSRTDMGLINGFLRDHISSNFTVDVETLFAMNEETRREFVVVQLREALTCVNGSVEVATAMKRLRDALEERREYDRKLNHRWTI